MFRSQLKNADSNHSNLDPAEQTFLHNFEQAFHRNKFSLDTFYGKYLLEISKNLLAKSATGFRYSELSMAFAQFIHTKAHCLLFIIALIKLKTALIKIKAVKEIKKH